MALSNVLFFFIGPSLEVSGVVDPYFPWFLELGYVCICVLSVVRWMVSSCWSVLGSRPAPLAAHRLDSSIVWPPESQTRTLRPSVWVQANWYSFVSSSFCFGQKTLSSGIYQQMLYVFLSSSLTWTQRAVFMDRFGSLIGSDQFSCYLCNCCLSPISSFFSFREAPLLANWICPAVLLFFMHDFYVFLLLTSGLNDNVGFIFQITNLSHNNKHSQTASSHEGIRPTFPPTTLTKDG